MRKPINGLQALRIAREQRERPIREPLEAEIARAARMIRELREALRSLEKVVGSKVGQMVIDEIGHKMSHEVQRQIMEAASKGYRKTDPDEPVTISVRAESLRWTDPKSLESYILREWALRSAPKARVRAGRDMLSASDVSHTVLDVRIPELGYRHAIYDGAL